MSVTLSTASPPSEKDIHLFQEAQKGNREARNELVETHFGLVVFWANKHKQAINTIPLEDLIQEGSIGLIKAVEMFDWQRGSSFSTYASWWIRHALWRAIGQSGVIKTPTNLRWSMHPTVISLDMTVGGLEDVSLMDCIEDPSVNTEEQILQIHLERGMRDAIRSLSLIGRFMIIKKYGLFEEDPCSSQEICQMMGITMRDFRRLFRGAFEEVRSVAIQHGLQHFL